MANLTGQHNQCVCIDEAALELHSKACYLRVTANEFMCGMGIWGLV